MRVSCDLSPQKRKMSRLTITHERCKHTQSLTGRDCDRLLQTLEVDSQIEEEDVGLWGNPRRVDMIRMNEYRYEVVNIYTLYL